MEYFFSSIFGHQGDIGATFKLSYHVEEIDMVVKYLECQNPSIISEDIGRATMVQKFRNGTEEEQRNGGVQLS